jgi:hypothetical protein
MMRCVDTADDSADLQPRMNRRMNEYSNYDDRDTTRRITPHERGADIDIVRRPRSIRDDARSARKYDMTIVRNMT